MERFELAVVIPALNVEETIEQIVVNVSQYGVAIVVDDGSSDSTAAVAEKAGSIVIRHDFNTGYDGALNSGFKYASENKFKYIITLDADGQHDPLLIKRFVSTLLEMNDIVIGIRNKKARFSEKIFGFYTNLTYGVKDPLCGIKAYKVELYEELGCFDSYNSIGTQLLMFALKKKKSVKQIEIEVLERKGSPRFASLIKANMQIFRAMIIGLIKRY